MSSSLRKASDRAGLAGLSFLTLCSLHMALISNPAEAAADNHDQNYLVYIGVYGNGVEALHFNSSTGAVESIGLVGTVTNPSWVATDREFKHLYAVSELEGSAQGSVASFNIDRKTGKLTPLNSVPSGGVAPCHASVDATGKTLVVANYTTGEVSAFPIQPDGSLGAMSSHEKAHGSGPNKDRQEGPHAHMAVVGDGNGRVYVPDLGLDRIRIYKLDAASGKLAPNDPPFVKGEPGLGPRHIVFDPRSEYAYVINELKPVVSVYSHDRSTGSLKLVQTVPTIPSDFTQENSGAEIRLDPSGKFLYSSNRGHDSIQVFAVHAADGKLQPVQTVSTEGEEPRGFALDPSGRFLLVGNQKTNSLVVFKVDGNSGKLTTTGQKLEITKPVDILFVPAS